MDIDINLGEIFDKVRKEFDQTNILVLGKTGVGKSTLINAVFGEDLAKTGVGKPCTEGIKEYTKEDYPIHLFDTKGLEMENYDEILDSIMSMIKTRKNSTDSKSHIHIAWYCINQASNRIEDGEINVIKTLSKEIPVIVILTQAISDNQEFFNKVDDICKNDCADVIEVIAKPFKIKGFVIEKSGLKELVSKTSETIPEAHRAAFIAAQKVDIELKKKKSYKIIAGSAAAAATAGAVPIPFSDVAVLAPIQLSMLVGISLAMGLDVTKSFIHSLVAAAAGITGASFAGRAIVSNIIKLIPGGGSILGGAISGTTAAVLTTTIGTAYLNAIEILIQRNIELSPTNISTTFKAILSNKLQKK